MKKTGTCRKDGHLWKRRALMEKMGIKHLKAIFFTHTGHNQYYTYNTSCKTSLGIFRACSPIGTSYMRSIIGLPRTYNKKTHLTF